MVYVTQVLIKFSRDSCSLMTNINHCTRIRAYMYETRQIYKSTDVVDNRMSLKSSHKYLELQTFIFMY